ncbi:hypothetical protein LIZ91_06065 [Enterococcus avium]|uniref:hypothetical protein n=1 Tax=Enterococcus avium TaxID=33945 RepID=UPI001D073BAD|nr:hypothetical protein [Enterococcus avium]MCB6916148.1 hypothetical protein [Enterococcus avium]MCQ4960006.1 hypothetical protein [Enterococcus avium]
MIMYMTKIFEFFSGIVIVCLVVALITKATRININNITVNRLRFKIRKFKNSFPKQIKKREFWFLQIYTIASFLLFLCKAFFTIFLVPFILFTVEPSYETFKLTSIILLLVIVIGFGQMCLKLINLNQSDDWRGLFKQLLWLIIYAATLIRVEKTYDLFSTASVSRINKMTEEILNNNLGWIVLAGIIGYVFLLHYLKNKIVWAVESDLFFDTKHLIELDANDKPKCYFRMFAGLVVIDSINIQYEDFDKENSVFLSEVVTATVHLRYSLLQFDFVKMEPRIVQEKSFLAKGFQKND